MQRKHYVAAAYFFVTVNFVIHFSVFHILLLVLHPKGTFSN